MWHKVALCSRDQREQLTAYKNAIEALQVGCIHNTLNHKFLSNFQMSLLINWKYVCAQAELPCFIAYIKNIILCLSKRWFFAYGKYSHKVGPSQVANGLA